MCLETVEGAKAMNSINWQTHNSPCLKAISKRTLFLSEIALINASKSFMNVPDVSPHNEVLGMNTFVHRFVSSQETINYETNDKMFEELSKM
jgi:hypothetical protein